MSYIICFYLLVAGWMFVVSYEATPEELKGEVRNHWVKYFGQCLLWPFKLVRKSKGFEK